MSVSNTVTKCDFCHSSFKSKYTLKNHIINNKSCLKKRGLKLETNPNMLIYTNPTKGKITIEIKEVNIEQIAVMDVKEKQLY